MKLLDGSQSGNKVQASVSKSADANLTTEPATTGKSVSAALTNTADGTESTYAVTVMDKDGNASTTTVKFTAGADEGKDADAIIKALKDTDLADKFDMEYSTGAKTITFTSKEEGVSSNVVLTQLGTAASAAATVTPGEDAYSKLAAGIGAYTGKGNIEDSIFTVNGEKFAYVTDPTKLGDDYKDVNYVQTKADDGTVDKDDAAAMAKLINAKTGIAAVADGNGNISLKAGSSNTGKGIELQIGANEGQTMSFTLDDMSADALGVGVGKVDLSKQESAKTATTTIDAAIKKVSAARGRMGAVQNRLEHTINNLDTAAENMQTAESRIRDTDMAEEMVNYSKNNILAQAGQSMLAQANQSNQGVLTLLQ